MKMSYAEYLALVLAGIDTARGLDPDDAYKVAQAVRDTLALACVAGGGNPVEVVAYIETAYASVSELAKQRTPVFE